jgi:predicted permease
MDRLLQNVRYAVRRLSKAPGFTAIVVLTLALGIGANSTIFSVVSTLLLRPLPYPEPDRLVTVNHFYPSLDDLRAPVSAQGFVLYRDAVRSFESAAVAVGGSLNMSVNGTPEQVQSAFVSADFFRVYGATPLLGRVPLKEEDTPGRDHVVVLTHGFWTRAFGADPKVIGRTLTLDGEPHEVIGVMPEGFQPFWNRQAEMIRPLALRPEQLASGMEWLNFSARLRPGVTIEAAREEMARVAERVKQDNPGDYPPTWTLTVTTLDDVQKGELRTPVFILLAAVGIVLLIACANVANLMLARSTARAREIAIRSSLGAGRRQLVFQLVTEAVVLSVAGGLLGTLIALWSVAALGKTLGQELPGIQLGVDVPVLVFTLVLSIVTGLAFGLLPALHASRPNLQGVMREGSRTFAGDRSGNFARRALVVGEVAIALTLLAGAGLLIRSLQALQDVDPGFRAENVLTFQLALPDLKYPDEAARTAFFERALQGIRATPGVTAAGLTNEIPFGGGWSTGSFEVEGYVPREGEPDPWGDQRAISEGFDRALGVTLVRGRFFTEQDVAGAPLVTVVDEELARRYWPNQDPIGKRIAEDDDVWLTVVGVVRHTKHAGLNDEDRVQLYMPYRQIGGGGMGQATIAVRTAGEPLAALAAVRRVIAGIDPEQPIARVETLESLVDRSLHARRLSVQLLTIFSGLAALLAALGIYGVISHMVAQRTRELGVRMALGAAADRVLIMVLRQGVGLALAGVGLGLVGALALTRLIASQLFEVSPSDPATFAITAALLVLVAVVATLLPAGRAARVSPMVALRAE